MAPRTKTLSDEAIGVAITLTDNALDEAIKDGQKDEIAKLVRALDEMRSYADNGTVTKAEKTERAPRAGGRRSRKGLPQATTSNNGDEAEA